MALYDCHDRGIIEEFINSREGYLFLCRNRINISQFTVKPIEDVQKVERLSSNKEAEVSLPTG